MCDRIQYALAALLTLTACKSNPSLTVGELDPGADLFSVLTVDAQGKLLSATPLSPMPKTGLPLIGDEDARILIAGFASEDLAPYRARPPQAVLRAAEGCDPVLEPPRWLGRWLPGDGIESVDPASIPDLTADWVEICDQDTLPWLDLHCSPDACVPERTKLGPCHYRLSLSECLSASEGESFEVRIDRSGKVCVPPNNLGCRAAEGPASYICSGLDGCAFDIHPRRAASPVTLGVRRTLAGSQHYPDWLQELPYIHGEGLLEGPLADFDLLDDRIVVVQIADRNPGEKYCGGGRSTMIHVLDRTTGEPRETMPGPSCLSRIRATGEGFVGVHQREGKWGVGVFDRTATELEFIPLPIERPDASSALRPAEIVVTPSVWYVVMTGTAWTEVLRINLPSKDPERLAGFDSDASAAAASDTVLYMADSTRLSLMEVSVADEILREDLAPATTTFVSTLGIDYDPRGYLFIAMTRPDQVMTLDLGFQVSQSSAASVYDWQPAITPVLPFAVRGSGVELGPRSLLVAGMAPGTRPELPWDATVSFGPAAPNSRFLPTSMVIGEGAGMPTRVRGDADHGLWVLLGWVSQLVRLDCVDGCRIP